MDDGGQRLGLGWGMMVIFIDDVDAWWDKADAAWSLERFPLLASYRPSGLDG